MNIQYGVHNKQNGANGTSNGQYRVKNVDQTESFQGVVEWLNQLIPSLNLPWDASEDELTSCLIDGTILCSILSKLIPASNATGTNSHSGRERVQGFLKALNEMGLPGFELSDLEEGNLMPILRCLKELEAHFNFDEDEERRWSSEETHSDKTVLAQGNVSLHGKLDQSDVKVLELLNSNRVDNSSTQSLFGVVNKILDENAGRKNGDISQPVAILLRKATRVVEHRFSTLEDNLKKQNSFYKAREEKFQSRLRTLETLAMGTIGENEVVMNVLHQIKVSIKGLIQDFRRIYLVKSRIIDKDHTFLLKIDKSKLEEREKLEDVMKLKKEKELRDEEIMMLKVEINSARKTHENHCLDLEAQAEKTKIEFEKKVKELERQLRESKAKVNELESFTESKYKTWKKKELAYRGFIDYQTGALQDLRNAFMSIKHELLKTKQSYAEEFNFMGMKIFVLTVHVRGTELKTGATLRGNLHLVDLAGSERVDRSAVSGDRMKEAQHINKSLSALGDVIFALAQKSPHVPYRNSKLTQVLQSSLGGHAKTLMFVQLNPDADSYLETVSTLKFAERVSGVELGAAHSNKEGRDLKGLMDQVASLKETIAKNEEEIERLQVKVQINTVKNSPRSLKNEYPPSPRRFSVGTPLLNQKLSKGAVSGRSEKAMSVMENNSVFSDNHSDICSLRSGDGFKHHKKSRSLPKIVVTKVSQNILNDDTDLLHFGEADSDERLSDISDGSLTMGGTETDGSMNSLVEYTLFPESDPKPVKKVEKPVAKAEKSGKITTPTKNQKPPPSRLVKTKSSVSLNKSPSPKLASSPRISTCGSPGTPRTPRRWQ
ncbi:hypothetical protein ACFE04_013431 [Oxalis oulophora]